MDTASTPLSPSRTWGKAASGCAVQQREQRRLPVVQCRARRAAARPRRLREVADLPQQRPDGARLREHGELVVGEFPERASGGPLVRGVGERTDVVQQSLVAVQASGSSRPCSPSAVRTSGSPSGPIDAGPEVEPLVAEGRELDPAAGPGVGLPEVQRTPSARVSQDGGAAHDRAEWADPAPAAAAGRSSHRLPHRPSILLRHSGRVVRIEPLPLPAGQALGCAAWRSTPSAQFPRRAVPCS